MLSLNKSMQVIGVVNVTNNSFSDGGQFVNCDQAIEHGIKLAKEGAHIIEVGGESTRPGACRVDSEQEIARIAPVVESLALQGISVSIDTMRAKVAKIALEKGASFINDVSGGLADKNMIPLLSDAQVPFIIMHWQSFSTNYLHNYSIYSNIPNIVLSELLYILDIAIDGGVNYDKIILDPGLGFAKTPQENWTLLNSLSEFVATGIPILIGASRKSFLGALLEGIDGKIRAPNNRNTATAVISILSALHGAWGVRVHDVIASVDALKVLDAWKNGG